MGAEPRFDMGDRYAAIETRERRAKGARGVALHDNQDRWPAQFPAQRRAHLLDMGVGISPPGAIEVERGETAQAEAIGLEPAVLPGEDEQRRQPAIVQRVRDRRQFDCFRAGPETARLRGTQHPPSSAQGICLHYG